MSDLCKNCGGCHLPLACRLALTRCCTCNELGHLTDFCPTGVRSRDKPFAYRMLCANCDQWHLPMPCEYPLQRCRQCDNQGHLETHCPVAPLLRVPAALSINLRYETTVTEPTSVGQPVVTKSVPVSPDVISLIRFDAAKTMLEMLKAYDPAHVVAIFARDVPPSVVSDNVLLIPRNYISLAKLTKPATNVPPSSQGQGRSSPQASAVASTSTAEHQMPKAMSGDNNGPEHEPSQFRARQNGSVEPTRQYSAHATSAARLSLGSTPSGQRFQAQVNTSAAQEGQNPLATSHLMNDFRRISGSSSFASPVLPSQSELTNAYASEVPAPPKSKKRKQATVDEPKEPKKKRLPPIPRCDDCKRRKKRCVHNVSATRDPSQDPLLTNSEAPGAKPDAAQGYAYGTSNASARGSFSSGLARSATTAQPRRSIETAAVVRDSDQSRFSHSMVHVAENAPSPEQAPDAATTPI